MSRNYLVAKELYLLPTSHGGLNFYIGNNPEASGGFMELDFDTAEYKKGIELEVNAGRKEKYMMKLAYVHIALQEFNEAMVVYEEVLAHNPGNALAHHNIGNIYYLTNNVELALEAWKRSLEIKPNNKPLVDNIDKVSRN